jgi:hypothetical protein
MSYMYLELHLWFPLPPVCIRSPYQSPLEKEGWEKLTTVASWLAAI